MKIRKGFVSNSSSSSFICDVCNNIESGYDMGLEEAGMCECENGHILCEDHKIDLTLDEKRNIVLNDDAIDNEEKERIKKLNDSKFEEYYVEYEADRDNIPTAFCPICQFKSITDRDLEAYLLKKAGSKKEEIVAEIKSKLISYEEFEKFLRKEGRL